MTGDRPRIIVCGLGPGGRGHVTAETLSVLASGAPVFLRTSRHPSADLAGTSESFDGIYEQADRFDDVYGQIVDELCGEARRHGTVVYAVPGSPLVLERSVRVLQRRGPDVDTPIDVQVLPAMSFLDVAWSRLGVDPVDDGVRLVDGHRFATEAAGERGPLLVAHAHADWVLSAIKLSVDDAPEATVTVMQRLGTADEFVTEVPWHELDRVEADHLTTLFIPELASPVGAELLLSVELMDRLRDQCPWDRSQDHGTLRKYLREEAYEVLDALDAVISAAPDAESTAYAELESELGDLWFQILFHCRLAAEQGQFTVAEVARTLTEKMVARHPHVFDGEVDFDGRTLPDRPAQADAVGEDQFSGDESTMARAWEAKKSEQTGRRSAFDGIPSDLPSLALADKVLGKATRLLGQPGTGPAVAEIRELLADSSVSGTNDSGNVDVSGRFGRLLLAMAFEARAAGLDLEHLLRETVLELVGRARQIERSRQDVGTFDPVGRWIVG